MGCEEDYRAPAQFSPSFQNGGHMLLCNGDTNFTTAFQHDVLPLQALSTGFPTFIWTSNDPGFVTGINVSENPIPPSLPSNPTATVKSSSNSPTTQSPVKKKRGRPCKLQAAATASTQVSPTEQSMKPTVRKLTLKQQLIRCGSVVSASAGTRLLPHILRATPGEDIAELISAFKETTTLAFCVISASGVLSSATLYNSGSAAGNMTYEGHLEISSLSGSYLPIEHNGSQVKCGGLGISFIMSDGQPIGGHVAGPLLAKTAVQMQILSFKFLSKQRESSQPIPNLAGQSTLRSLDFSRC